MSTTDTHVTAGDDIREEAVQRLKNRRDFHAHLLVYTLVTGP
jgi:hypothetical protein